MRFLKLFSFLVGLLVCLGCEPVARQGQAVPPLEADNLNAVFTAINEEVLAHSEAYKMLDSAISEIGHRLTGSENGRKAEIFAFDLLQQYGYSDLSYFPFKVEAWSRESISMAVDTGKGYAPFPVVSLAHSPVQFEGEADLLDVGNGLRKDFERVKAEVPGKFTLINLHLDGSDSTAKNLHRTEKTALAIEYGAAGVIFINGIHGNVLLTGAASVTGSLIPIPAVCIGKENGQRLRAIEGPLRARLQMKNHSDQISARNVVARFPGHSLPEEKVIIGAHLDSWDLSTGAIDNGIGAFAVIEIARVFQKLQLKPRRTIEFVLFMGEEQGLLGSTAMVEHMLAKSELKQVRYMVNLDMSGNPMGFRSMGRKDMNPWLEEIGKEISGIDRSFQNKVGGKAGLHSDHQPFMLEGIPVLGIISNLDPKVYNFYHSDGDDFHLVNKAHLQNSARFTAMMLYGIANAAEIPALQMTSEETRDFLIQQGLKEKLVLGREWKWGPEVQPEIQ